MLDAYLTLKMVPYVLIALVIIIVTIIIAKEVIFSKIKSKILTRAGFVYDYGLGTSAAYEYQPRWEKGSIKVNNRRVMQMSIKEVKHFCKEH